MWRQAKHAHKKQKTEEEAPIRCRVIKDYPGQENEPRSLAIKQNEIVLKFSVDGAWAVVQRERDDKEGIVPLRRLEEAPLPPDSPLCSSDADCEDEGAAARRQSPQVSDDDEGAPAAAEGAQAAEDDAAEDDASEDDASEEEDAAASEGSWYPSGLSGLSSDEESHEQPEARPRSGR